MSVLMGVYMMTGTRDSFMQRTNETRAFHMTVGSADFFFYPSSSLDTFCVALLAAPFNILLRLHFFFFFQPTDSVDHFPGR